MGDANSTVASALKNSPAVLNKRVYQIDGDHLSRPGPRLVDGLEDMARALHPEAFKSLRNSVRSSMFIESTGVEGPKELRQEFNVSCATRVAPHIKLLTALRPN